MSAVTYKFGRGAQLYHGTAGQTAATIIEDVKDVTVTTTTTAIDISTRSSGPVKVYGAGMTELEVSWNMLCRTSGEAYTALRTAYTTGAPLSLKALNGTAGEGLDGDFILTEFTEEQALDDSVNVSCKAQPTFIDDTRPVTWISASGN